MSSSYSLRIIVLEKILSYQSIWAPLGMVFVVLCAVCTSSIHYQGDIDEYILMSAAIADHGTPDVRTSDAKHVAEALPLMKPVMEQIASGMETGQTVPKPGFYRAQSGDYFAIHFFGYSALVAIPFKIFEILGIPPLKAFLLVNLLAVCALAVSARIFFGDWVRATACVFLWMVCGGVNYLYWLGPEIVCAALLTSSIFLYLSERRIWAGISIGFAALQNPPIILALAFVPLLKLVHSYRSDHSFVANVRQQLTWCAIVAALLGTVLFVSTIAFNWWAFATPNIIMKVATIPSLMGGMRLFSFFFDLNQGMVTGFAGIWLALLIFFVRYRCDTRFVFALLVTCLFSIVLALPALTTGNWNSGGIGMMRYAFWAGTPFFALFMYQWRQELRSPVSMICLAFVLQLALTIGAFRSLKPDFNFVSQLALRYVPNLYNPEPELFIERNAKFDGTVLDPQRVYEFRDGARVTKRIYHQSLSQIAQKLCGLQGHLKHAGNFVEAGYGWRYFNGDLSCVTEVSLGVDAFDKDARLSFGGGWSATEFAGAEWSGRWSDGESSILRIQNIHELGDVELILIGHYYQNVQRSNQRTLVTINGQNFGWHNLEKAPRFRLQGSVDGNYEMRLRHQAPQQMTPNEAYPNGRRLALFLNTVKLQGSYPAKLTTAD